MKKLLFVISMISLSILFGGCPYSSKVPMDNPTEKINSKFIGTWDEQKDGDVYKISKKDDFNYEIEVTNKKNNSSKLDHYIAYSTVINGVTFMNISETSSDKKYMICKIETSGDDFIKVFMLTENIEEQFTAPEKLKSFVSANMKNSYLYDKDKMILIRNKN